MGLGVGLSRLQASVLMGDTMEPPGVKSLYVVSTGVSKAQAWVLAVQRPAFVR